MTVETNGRSYEHRDPRTFAEVFDGICGNVRRAIRGKDDVIALTVTCLVARGHLLLEDVPGVGKTSLSKALARSIDADFRRVQFTPDLLREVDHDRVLAQLRPVATAEDVLALGEAAERVYVADALVAYLVDLAQRSREASMLRLGVSPRAVLGLLRAARVRAAADGREFVTPDDIKSLAVPVLAHRIVIGPDSRLSGLSPDEAVDELLAITPVPG